MCKTQSIVAADLVHMSYFEAENLFMVDAVMTVAKLLDVIGWLDDHYMAMLGIDDSDIVDENNAYDSDDQ